MVYSTPQPQSNMQYSGINKNFVSNIGGMAKKQNQSPFLVNQNSSPATTSFVNPGLSSVRLATGVNNNINYSAINRVSMAIPITNNSVVGGNRMINSVM